MLTKISKTKIKNISKWVCLSLIIVICFSIMTTGGHGRARALLLIPVTIAIAMNNNELVAGIIGAICGMLTDIALDRLIGVNAILFMLIGVFSAFFFLNLVRRNIFNVVIMTAIAAIIHGLLDFFFFYVMWGYAGKSVVFVKIILLSVLLTVIVSPVVYFVVKMLTDLFTEKEGLRTETRKK